MKRRLEFAVTREMAGRSVRQFLQEELSFSGHQISRLKFQEEGIRVDGEKVYVNHVLKEGEILTVGLTEQVLRRDTEGGKPGKIWEAPAPELSKYPLQSRPAWSVTPLPGITAIRWPIRQRRIWAERALRWICG